jgi:hypothetical protein
MNRPLRGRRRRWEEIRLRSNDTVMNTLVAQKAGNFLLSEQHQQWIVFGDTNMTIALLFQIVVR